MAFPHGLPHDQHQLLAVSPQTLHRTSIHLLPIGCIAASEAVILVCLLSCQGPENQKWEDTPIESNSTRQFEL